MTVQLSQGDLAPQFQGEDQNGEIITLSQFEGKKVILYFYPKDSTPGCTAQACNLRDNYQILLDKGFAIIGVSADSKKRHQNFISKNSLPFPLISDEDHEVLEAYGVWGMKKFMGREFLGIKRTTFVIDSDGKIEKIFDKVKTKDHSQQILDSYL